MLNIPKILIADDHPLFRAALSQSIAQAIPASAITEAHTFEDCQKALDAASDTDLLLLDINMPGMQGFSGLLYVRAQYPQVPVAIVSAFEDGPVIRSAFDYGAQGYIPKSMPIDEIGKAISALLDGDTFVPAGAGEADDDDERTELAQKLSTLTPQQVRVLMFLSEGKLNKQIAWELSISEATVKAHVSAILQKLGVNSRTQAVIIAGQMSVEDRALSEARGPATPPPSASG